MLLLVPDDVIMNSVPAGAVILLVKHLLVHYCACWYVVSTELMRRIQQRCTRAGEAIERTRNRQDDWLNTSGHS